MVNLDKHEWAFDAHEKYAIQYLEERGFEVTIKKRYISKDKIVIEKEHLFPEATPAPVQAYSYAPPPEPVENTITYDSDTEFGQRIHGRDPGEVWPLIDELTEALAVVNPRLYDSFIQRL